MQKSALIVGCRICSSVNSLRIGDVKEGRASVATRARVTNPPRKKQFLNEDSYKIMHELIVRLNKKLYKKHLKKKYLGGGGGGLQNSLCNVNTDFLKFTFDKIFIMLNPIQPDT